MTEKIPAISESSPRHAELSVGIVGAGEITSRIHLPVLTACDGIRIAYVTDKNAHAARAVGEGYKLAAITMPANIEELPVTDVALLAVPVGTRAVLRAFRAAKNSGPRREAARYFRRRRRTHLCDVS